MSVAANKAVCRRHYEEVLTQKRLDVVEEIYAEQIAHGEGQSMPRAQFGMLARATATAFPDLQVTVHEQIGEGDFVVTRWSATGTHLGDFMGHAGTGRRVQITAIHIHEVKGGRICHLWEQIDLLGLSKQLGIAIP